MIHAITRYHKGVFLNMFLIPRQYEGKIKLCSCEESYQIGFSLFAPGLVRYTAVIHGAWICCPLTAGGRSCRPFGMADDKCALLGHCK